MRRKITLTIITALYFTVGAIAQNDEITTDIVNTFKEGNTPFAEGVMGAKYEIPGVIQLEWLDAGENGVAYNETDAFTTNGTLEFRLEDAPDIDFETKDVPADDPFGRTGTMTHIGWWGVGEWYEYTVDVKETGIYTLKGLFATKKGISFVIYVNDSVHTVGDESISFAGTNNWNLYEESVFAEDVKIAQGEYTFRVKVLSGGFNLDYMTFTKTGEWITTGIESAKLNGGSTFKAFPNPASQILNIANISSGSKVSLVDMMGKELFSTVSVSDNMTINTSDYRVGMYILKVNNGIKKIMIK